MDISMSPALASLVWVGGGSFCLLLIAVFVPPLLRRKPLERSAKNYTKPRD
jgi:hypothetical protein